MEQPSRGYTKNRKPIKPIIKMKKLFTLLFAAGIATGAFATDQDKVVSIRQTEAKKVAISYSAIPNGTVIVKITDSQERLVMRDKINKEEAFAKRYDLNALPEGTYQVEVTDESGVLRTASFDTFVAEKPAVFSRVSKMGDNKYRLLVSNLEAKEVLVSIYDGDHLVYSERIDNPQGLHKIYDIAKPSGNITFKVSTASGFESYVSSRY
jgi:flagellar hook assembly protein FlgD